MEISGVMFTIPAGAAGTSPRAFEREKSNVVLLRPLLRGREICSRNKAPRCSISLPLKTLCPGDRRFAQWQGAASCFRRPRDTALFATAVQGGSIDGTNEGQVSSSLSRNLPDDPGALKAALLAAETRALTAEKSRQDALDALSISEAKAREHAALIAHTTEKAMAELEASKELLRSELESRLEEKSRELAVAKENSISLAVNVEKAAQLAVREAAYNLSEEARLKAVAEDTAAAEAVFLAEDKIRQEAAKSSAQIMKDAYSAMNEAMAAATLAREQATRARETRVKQLEVFDELAQAKSEALTLEEKMLILQQQLTLSEDLVRKLRVDLTSAQVKIDEASAREAQAEATIREFQQAAERAALERDESMKQALETIKATIASREEVADLVVNTDLEALKTAYSVAEEASRVKELANLRMVEALERSLCAAEGIAKAWKTRALSVESYLQRVKEEGQGALPIERTDDIMTGGRMEMVLKNESKRWDLLANGPRRETPDWMKRGIELGLQGLPPRNPVPITSDVKSEVPLELPTASDVWSISSAKVKEDDLFTKHAVEKEALDEQRRALERALQQKTIKRHLEDAEGKPESGTGSGHEIVFQGFNWESWRRKWYLELGSKAADLSKCGITTIWLPPPTESVSPQGYMPGDLYNLNSAYGTVDELKQCIEELHRNDILVLGDAVLNHRCAQKQSSNGIWNIFGGKLAWGPEAIVKDDPNFQGKGNPSNGDFFHAAPNIDHSQDFVRKDIIGWMQWLRTEIGFDGWRLDFVRGFWGGYVKEYIEETKPVFAIGEYWDSLAYEGGQVCYNQDAHRQRIINWINATGGTSSAFDVTTKGILHSALHNEFWRLIDPQGKPPGVMGWWPSRAVTFLENHDTGSTQGHWPFPRDKLMQGYAYILTHPGTPVIFYDHFYDFGLHDQIAELIAARKLTGVHCRSPVKILHANFDGYVAQIGDNLVMKIGRLDWNPSKENKLVGIWERFLDHGADYQLWQRG